MPVDVENTSPDSTPTRRRSSAVFKPGLTVAQKKAEALRRRRRSMEASIPKTPKKRQPKSAKIQRRRSLASSITFATPPAKPVLNRRATIAGPLPSPVKTPKASPRSPLKEITPQQTPETEAEREAREQAQFEEVHYGNLDALDALEALHTYHQTYGQHTLGSPQSVAEPVASEPGAPRVALRPQQRVDEASAAAMKANLDAKFWRTTRSPLEVQLHQQLVLYVAKTSKDKSNIALSAYSELCIRGAQACVCELQKNRKALIEPRHQKQWWILAGCLAIFAGISLIVAACRIPRTRGRRLLENVEKLVADEAATAAPMQRAA